MALFSRLLLFFCLLAIGEYALGVTTPATALIAGNNQLNSQYGYNATTQTTGSWWSNSLGIISNNGGTYAIIGVALVVVAAAGFGFVLPILIFIPVAIFFLTVVTYPQSLINAPGMPTSITFLLNLLYAVLNILFVYSLITWIRQME